MPAASPGCSATGGRPGGRGLTAALADRVRLLVLDGRLPLQMRVPAERELAAALDVSRTTVAAAYEVLREAGILHSRRGAGSWTQLPPGIAASGVSSPFSPHGDRTLYDLAHASLAAPATELRAAAALAVEDLDAHLSGHGYDLLGLPALRAAIARRFTARGLPTTADQVLVTAGGQAAIALVLAALTTPGDRVLVEHPTYPNALDAVRARGARVRPGAARPRLRRSRGVGPRPASPRRCATPPRGWPTSCPTTRTRPGRCSTARDANGWSRWPAAPARRC